MGRIRFVTLDCAGTLVRVNWQPEAFACDCLEELGIAFDRPDAESTYKRLLQSRWREYQELNRSRDENAGDAFWEELTRDWLERINVPAGNLKATIDRAHLRLYGEPSFAFSLYEDTRPAIDALAERGYRLAVLSNWDYSLHRVLNRMGIASRFDVVLASLEEGVEKPEPEIFRIALERLGAAPEETVHVGDDPLDDVAGAKRAGIRPVFLDRGGTSEWPHRITRLTELAEVLDWNG